MCVGPTPVAEPPARDPEEFSIEVERVGIDRLRELMYDGSMMLPSIITAQMALNALDRDGSLRR